MKKSLIAFLVVVMLIISVFPVSAASDSAVLAINCPQELPKTGEKVEITVDISNNPGICAVQFTLSYDKNIAMYSGNAWIDGAGKNKTWNFVVVR